MWSMRDPLLPAVKIVAMVPVPSRLVLAVASDPTAVRGVWMKIGVAVTAMDGSSAEIQEIRDCGVRRLVGDPERGARRRSRGVVEQGEHEGRCGDGRADRSHKGRLPVGVEIEVFLG